LLIPSRLASTWWPANSERSRGQRSHRPSAILPRAVGAAHIVLRWCFNGQPKILPSSDGGAATRDAANRRRHNYWSCAVVSGEGRKQYEVGRRILRNIFVISRTYQHTKLSSQRFLKSYIILSIKTYEYPSIDA
jgi:hypothetical protein